MNRGIRPQRTHPYLERSRGRCLHAGRGDLLRERLADLGFSGVFEDDGRTGYFYAYDRAAPDEERILDACHIYNAASVVDRDRPSDVEIIWTADGLKAALLINDFAHAVIDFRARRAYCRTNFPPPTGPWRAEARSPWDDTLLADFREAEA